MDGCQHRMDGLMDDWMNWRISGWMDGQKDGRMNGWVDGWMDVDIGWMD